MRCTRDGWKAAMVWVVTPGGTEENEEGGDEDDD
jgi:hypothetical protein